MTERRLNQNAEKASVCETSITCKGGRVLDVTRKASNKRPPKLQFPLDVVFRHGSGAEPIKTFVHETADRLSPVSDRITYCRGLLVERNASSRETKQYRVCIRLSISHKQIVVEHEAYGTDRESLYDAIRTCFNIAHHRAKIYRENINRTNLKRCKAKAILHNIREGDIDE